jgi:glycosyltransferase involved in cell wall biosynthesis
MRLHDEVPSWISACDVLCLPSRREGCPNVVLEALASGRPVVASRVGGVPEILSPESGVIVDPENPAALAQGISAALDRGWDPRSLRDCVECLSWDDVGRSYHRQLVESLRERHAAPAGSQARAISVVQE